MAPGRILLCEKDAYFLELTLQSLRMAGVKNVSGYRDAGDALRASSKLHFDAAIVSEDTHPFDGLALIDRLRSADRGRHGSLPFILVCDSVSDAKLKRLRTMGSALALIRPFSASGLARHVSVILASPGPIIEVADPERDDGEDAVLL